MNVTPELTGLVGIVAGVLGKSYAAKRSADSSDTATAIGTLVRLLDREKDEHRVTRDRLSQSQTESDMRGAQVGDLSARVEMLTERVAELLGRMTEVLARVEDLDAKNDDCERRNAALTTRVHKLERRNTPPDMTAVQPEMHEEVGHE